MSLYRKIDLKLDKPDYVEEDNDVYLSENIDTAEEISDDVIDAAVENTDIDNMTE